MADPFLTLNGQSGEYLTRDDVNLLDADTAHGQQGFGGWGSNVAANVSIDTPPVAPIFGVTCLKFTIQNTGPDVQVKVSGVDIVPGVANTYTVWLLPTIDGLEAELRTAWDGNVFSGYEPLPEGVWTRRTMTVVADPAPTVGDIHIRVRGLGATDVPIGEGAFASAIIVREGTDPTFVPSIQIVGDLSFEIDAQVAWTQPMSIQGIRFSGNNGVNCSLATNELRMAIKTTDAASHFINFGASGLADGVRARYRCERVLATGVCSAFIDDAPVGGNPVAGPGLSVIHTNTFPWAVGDAEGGTLVGDVFDATIRDGIGGPIVYRMDPADVLAAI